MSAHSTPSGAVRVCVIVTSDSRTPATDESGRLAVELLRAAGHEADPPLFVSNDPSGIATAVSDALAGPARLVLLSGGTGLGPRDNTVEAVAAVVVKRLDGFGEAFRALSFAEIGPAAILSRAMMGATSSGKIVACTPGSPKAMRLALERLILPELGHLVHEASR